MPFDDLTGWRRQIWRGMLLFVMVTQLTVLGNSWIRRGVVTDLENRVQQHVTEADAYHHQREQTGAARAKVSVLIVQAIADGRSFTPQERQEISDLWHQAEFDKIQAKFLDGQHEKK